MSALPRRLPRPLRRAPAWLARHAPVLLALLLFLAAALLLFGAQTVGGRSMVPWDARLTDPVYREALEDAGVEGVHNDLVADLVFQNVAWKQLLAERLATRELPLWSPHQLGGLPFFAAGQHSALFPTTWLHLALGVDRGFGWVALLHLLLAAGSAYLLARALALGRPAAALAGAAWGFSTLFVINALFPMIQGALIATPLLLAAIARLTEPGRPARWLPTGRDALWWIVGASAAALVALAGHAEMLVYAALVATAFGLLRLWTLYRAEDAGAAARGAAWLAGCAGAGLLLAGVQLLPMIELARTGSRAGTPYQEAVSYAFGLRQLATFLLPDAFGNPSHHAVLDIRAWQRVALPGHAMWGTAWGTKNYVEAAAYLGWLPLLLAVVALFDRRRRALVLFFAGLALVSLSFAFGTPTYRLLHALPGLDQLHTPFRWVMPYSLAVVLLAALGTDALLRAEPSARALRAARVLGTLALAGSAAGGLGLVLAFAFPERWIDAVESAVTPLPELQTAILGSFPDFALFASYLFWVGLHAAVFLALSGISLLVLTEPDAIPFRRRGAVGLLLLVALLDSSLPGIGFFPALDPALGEIRPGAVAFLDEATEVKWGRAVGFGEDRVLWPNAALREGLLDLRGYDSLIPSWTAETLSAVEDQSGSLLYNRIGNLKQEDALAHPALRALGARYLLTRERLEGLPGVAETPIYDDEIRIYENEQALPRAWLVNQVRVVEDHEALLADLQNLDPLQEVLLEEPPDLAIWEELEPGRQVYRVFPTVKTDAANELELDLFAPAPGLLVLSEAYFPGWRAFVVTATPEGPQEAEVPVYRANGMLRAIPVPAGRMTLRVSYFPMSAKLGLYASFLGAILLLLCAAFALWTRFVRVREGDDVGLIAVNSAGPIAAALLNKALLFVFAMLYLRVIGPEGNGKYTIAVTVYGLAEVVSGFGLNLLATREIAKRPQEASRYLVNTWIARLGFSLLVVPFVAGWVLLRGLGDAPLDRDTIAALALLLVALVPANLNAGLSSVLQGMERMMVPAAVSILSALLTVSLGALALVAGFGFVGMAGAAVLTNWLAFLVLLRQTMREGVRPVAPISLAFVASMLALSWPLMLNQLLQSVFFKIDILLLDRLQGATIVGWYGSAYKWVDALLILPAYLTMALFPLMSRRAEGDQEGLRRAWHGSSRWLLALSLLVAVATTFLAEPLIRLLAGEAYLPHGARALQILIWFLPLSFVNGVTQYVLIAVGRQRWITLSFLLAVSFNIVANLLVIPRWSYAGAAGVTIASEAILLLPFFYGLRDLGPPSLLILAWRPLFAASAMALVLAGTGRLGWPWPVGLALGLPAFLGSLYALGWLREEDRALLARLRPGRGGAPPEAAPGPDATP